MLRQELVGRTVKFKHESKTMEGIVVNFWSDTIEVAPLNSSIASMLLNDENYEVQP